jgi:hypothetical protein
MLAARRWRRQRRQRELHVHVEHFTMIEPNNGGTRVSVYTKP